MKLRETLWLIYTILQKYMFTKLVITMLILTHVEHLILKYYQECLYYIFNTNNTNVQANLY